MLLGQSSQEHQQVNGQRKNDDDQHSDEDRSQLAIVVIVSGHEIKSPWNCVKLTAGVFQKRLQSKGLFIPIVPQTVYRKKYILSPVYLYKNINILL